MRRYVQGVDMFCSCYLGCIEVWKCLRDRRRQGSRRLIRTKEFSAEDHNKEELVCLPEKSVGLALLLSFVTPGGEVAQRNRREGVGPGNVSPYRRPCTNVLRRISHASSECKNIFTRWIT